MTTTETICAPWRPIAYNSRKPGSQRYAAPKLAADIKVHNITGQKLRCWAGK